MRFILNKDISEFHFEEEEIDQLKWIDLNEARKILADPKVEDWVKKPWDEDVLNWLVLLQK